MSLFGKLCQDWLICGANDTELRYQTIFLSILRVLSPRNPWICNFQLTPLIYCNIARFFLPLWFSWREMLSVKSYIACSHKSLFHHYPQIDHCHFVSYSIEFFYLTLAFPQCRYSSIKHILGCWFPKVDHTTRFLLLSLVGTSTPIKSLIGHFVVFLLSMWPHRGYQLVISSLVLLIIQPP